MLVELAPEKHCQEHAQPQVDPALLLCKFHCLSEIQTLDHPEASVPALADVLVLLVPVEDSHTTRKPLVGNALRSEANHHGGSPPLYVSTARLRI